MDRRRFLFSALPALPLAASPAAFSAHAPSATAIRAAAVHDRFKEIEQSLDGRLGVFALDTSDGAQVAHRAAERFPMCSTFKLMLAGAVLRQSAQWKNLLERQIRYGERDLVTYSPVTEKHLEEGMTVAGLCAAALQYSDNTAANLLIDLLGGPLKITEFARSIGDRQFRLDRRETELNSALPGDPRDTTTPQAMAHSLAELTLGKALGMSQRRQLVDWIKGNTTGGARIRAGMPVDWQVGDKTGTGDYGSANDVGVVWLPGRAPLIVAIYTTRRTVDDSARNDVIAAAAKVVADWAKRSVA